MLGNECVCFNCYNHRKKNLGLYLGVYGITVKNTGMAKWWNINKCCESVSINGFQSNDLKFFCLDWNWKIFIVISIFSCVGYQLL